MTLIPLAIAILYLCIGVIILGGVIWIALKVIRNFFPVDDRVEKAVWGVFLILILIFILTSLNGGGMHSLNFG